ncbi:tetratricopeptide repeat protein [Bdellovibrio sp. HCB209]|uniref:tetratricopeptide repeat protein n=1 Tax=Bdellovibrio sp. HCB209 TaxID=3394354 RepID=UPI0039B37D5D
MPSFFQATASIGLLLTLTACGSIPTKKTAKNSETKNLTVPALPTDPVNVRAEADYQFILSEVASREGKTAQAIQHLEKVATLDPKSPVVHLRLAAEYLKSDKMKLALQHGEIAVKNDPKSIEARFVLARLYSAERMHDQAISQYNAVLGIDPKNSEAPFYIAALYADKKDFAKAEQHFNSLIKNPKNQHPEEATYYLGLMYLDQKSAKSEASAENAFKKALKIKPNYEEAMSSLVNLYLKQRNRDKALASALAYQKQHGVSDRISGTITQIYIDDGNIEKAYEQLAYIAGNSEPSMQVQMKMALILIKQQRLNQAESTLKDMVASYPTADAPRFYLAAVQEELGNHDDAIRNYMMIPATSEHFSESIIHAAYLLKGMGKINQALNVAQSGISTKAQPQIYTMYASLLDAKADYLGAVRILEQGLSKYSKNVSLLFQHALVLDRLGKKSDMIEQMKKVLSIDPDHVQSMSYLAFSLAELNQQLPEAEKLARRALELDPKDGYVMDTLGWVLFKQNKIAESIQVLEKAHQYQASAGIIAEHLADAYSMQAQPEKAKAMYTKAAELTTDKKRANQIRNKIQKLVF